jgi:hypothetical protein
MFDHEDAVKAHERHPEGSQYQAILHDRKVEKLAKEKRDTQRLTGRTGPKDYK